MEELKLQFKDDVNEYLKSQWCCNEALLEHGEDQTEQDYNRLREWLASPPSFTTLRINLNAQTGESTVQELQKILSVQYEDRGKNLPSVLIHPKMKDTIIIPNVGPNQVDVEEKQVIVGLGCGVAVLRGADVYAQGVMAAPSHVAVNDRVSVFADVEGAVRKGLTKPFTGRKLFVGNGIALMSRSEIFCGTEKVTGLAIKMTQPLYVAPSLSGLLQPLIFPQNLPSIVCSHVLDPQPGETVLDMCAAPGGKTTHIASLMNNKGRIVALDKSKGKIKNIETNAAHWNLTMIEAFHFDGTKALEPSAELEGCPPYPAECFDRVLLDAPCSALGQRPAVQNAMTLPEVTSYPPLQRKLFTAAVGLLKPGGVLVYSTCTWTMEENERLVSWAVNTFPDISLAPQTPHLGGQGRPGSNLSPQQRALVQRFGLSPLGGSQATPESDTIAFFCAKFIKLKR